MFAPQKICLGTSDFDEIDTEKPLFVDMTMFINDFMEDGSEVSCILRSRRFGKSTNLSMFKSFLYMSASPESFKDF